MRVRVDPVELREKIDAVGNTVAVAEYLGISRTTISRALSSGYLSAQILEKLDSLVESGTTLKTARRGSLPRSLKIDPQVLTEKLDKLGNLKHAAERLGVSDNTVYLWRRDGRISAEKLALLIW